MTKPEVGKIIANNLLIRMMEVFGNSTKFMWVIHRTEFLKKI